jgi:ferredoxin
MPVRGCYGAIRSWRYGIPWMRFAAAVFAQRVNTKALTSEQRPIFNHWEIREMTRRQVIQIDEAKCDGCGQCVPACAEGAIQLMDGKAKLVADVYCDGLGACLGKCPRDAITIVEREAEPFDEAVVRGRRAVLVEPASKRPVFQGCPDMAMQEFPTQLPSPGAVAASDESPERPPVDGLPALCHWPIQLHLVSPAAPFLKQADLFLVADCVPFACADFHDRILRRRPVVVGCPKLDDRRAYVEKLADIFRQSALKSLTVVHMDVPCCTQLLQIAVEAVRLSGATVPLAEITIFRNGQMSKAVPRTSETRSGCICEKEGTFPLV